MRYPASLFILFTALLILIPMGGVFIEENMLSQNPQEQPITQSEEPPPEPLPTPQAKLDYTKDLKVYDIATDKVYTITALEFVAGSVAVEMPPSFHPDALAAQAVAAHTYARYCQLFNETYNNEHLKGADFAIDSQNRVGYLTKEQVRALYPTTFEENWEIISKAAEIGVNHIIEYESAPILAAYHATSAGMTEGAENVWNSGFDYLAPVESAGDLQVRDYRVEVEFAPKELKTLLKKAFPDAKLPSDHTKWLTPLLYSPSGYITEIQIGDQTYPTKQLRTALNLRSTNFTINYNQDMVIITTLGYGHGVGLSQNGANFLANEGSDYIEILAHYYLGTKIVEVK